MSALRYSLIVLLVLGSLGLCGFCAEAAGCEATEIAARSACHERELSISGACCCGEEISSDPAAIAPDREVLSATPIQVAASWARPVDPPGVAAGSAAERPPAASVDRQALFCVRRT